VVVEVEVEVEVVNAGPSGNTALPLFSVCIVVLVGVKRARNSAVKRWLWQLQALRTTYC
jgi:hypothetical protein